MAVAGPSYCLLLLVVLVAALAPQLSDGSGVQVSPEEKLQFGRQTVTMTVDDPGSSWFGDLIEAVETKLGIPVQSLQGLGGTIERYYLDPNDDRFLELVLKGADGTAKLLFRLSDLYLIGFANRDDVWFALKGFADLMPGATELSFGCSYRELLQVKETEKTKDIFAKLAIGTVPILEAVSTLATNNPSNLKPEVPSALGLFTVTVPESLIFIHIRVKVYNILESGSIGYLDDEADFDYVMNWANASMLMWCSSHGRPLGKKRGLSVLKKIGIPNANKAISIVAIMKWGRDYDPQDPAASCDDPVNNGNAGVAIP